MTGTCLCGAVSVTIDAKPDFIHDCNCSLCRKSGGAWGYFPPAAVTTTGGTRAYARTDKSAPAVEVHTCETCATTTHWVRTEAFKAQYGMNDLVGVNMRLFDPDALTGVEVRFPDGKGWTGEGEFGFRRTALTLSETVRW
ncbi:MAG: GFA family protein [Hyphomonas sp.]|nr:GFA family protein [Hyphomonas sp.]